MIYEAGLREGYTLPVQGEIVHGLFGPELEGAAAESEAVKRCSSIRSSPMGPVFSQVQPSTSLHVHKAHVILP